MSNEALRIYVSVDDDAMLPEAKRRVREEALAVLREVGLTALDVETHTAPHAVIDQGEEVMGGVTVTIRGAVRDGSIASEIDIKIEAALIVAGFDPMVKRVEIEEQ